MGYCLINENYNYIHYHETHIHLDEFDSFHAGKWLDLTVSEPFIVELDCPVDEHPSHHISTSSAPIFSGAMIEQFRKAGIDNFQLFPVHLVNRETGQSWPDYFAFNALGVIDAANMDASDYDTIMGGSMDGDGLPPYVGFHKLVIDPSKVQGALMFREIRSPTTLVFDDKVLDYLRNNKPPEGWGIRIKKLESVQS